jgi:signal transduction histidine kinase
VLSQPPLARLRWAFLALGAALLVAVGLPLHSALSRLDEQRLIRHRMVAERVFDEAEREVSSLLQLEAKRPSDAYDAQDTDPDNWAPFVVGYYRREPELRLVAEDALPPARRARVRAVVSSVRTVLDAVTESTASQKDADGDAVSDEHARSSPDVLRQLNRGVKVRERRQRQLTRSFRVVPTGEGTLVIERASSSFDRREGFVLDSAALVSSIQGWVLSAQGLDAVAALSIEPRADGADRRSYDFSHRLAPPFESQHISLRLSRLDDEDAGSTLYGLAALLATAAVGGLFALYRMVAVQLTFAERRDNFVSAVTHELKTPLTAIRMYGEMLRDGMVQDETARREYYAIITAEGERLTRLINNVMEHARLRRGSRPMQLVRADAGAVVREVIEVMAPHLAREGFRVEVEVAADLPEAHLDVDAFKQVLFNVIDNAIKYGRSGDASVLQVACSHEAGEVLVRVRDFGPGIAEHQLELVFEPFFRGEHELTRRHQGTGIGLSLVRELVGQMNGGVQGHNRRPGLEIRIALGAA